MQTDPLGDFLTILRNASSSAKSEVTVTWSRMRSDVAHILKNEGYLIEVEKVTDKDRPAIPHLKLELRGTGKSRAITQITRISKPGKRRYVAAGEIPRVLGGMGIAVVSTPRGVMVGHQAKKQNVGGELLLTVY